MELGTECAARRTGKYGEWAFIPPVYDYMPRSIGSSKIRKRAERKVAGHTLQRTLGIGWHDTGRCVVYRERKCHRANRTGFVFGGEYGCKRTFVCGNKTDDGISKTRGDHSRIFEHIPL